MGIKVLCFDKDNTLMLPSSSFHSNDNSNNNNLEIKESFLKLFGELKKDFKISIISNSAGNYSKDKDFIQASMIESKYGINVIRHQRSKPFCTNEFLAHFSLFKKDEIILIGDRLFTDILMANKMGIKSVFVHPLTEAGEGKLISFLRKIEFKILNYAKN